MMASAVPSIPKMLESMQITVVKKDGSALEVAIGEDEDDPVLCITDLLPHLAQAQGSSRLQVMWPHSAQYQTGI